jgi:DnaJ domain
MDYYEELGLRPTASLAEIQDAYHCLARILHPDPGRNDPQARRLAEIQLRRLNTLYAVLSDPARRRSYDARLAREAAGQPGRHVGNIGWLAAAVAGIAGLAWYLAPQHQRNHLILEPAAAIADTSAVSPVLSPPDRLSSADETAGALPDPTAAPDSSASGDIAPAPAAFTGSWTRAGEEPAEAVISEEDGWLRGRYQARYRAADGPAPLEVLLYFEGRPQGNPASLRWMGGDGSLGEVRLTLLEDGSLELVWSAAGSQGAPWPSSGSAVLFRQAP